MTMIPASSSQTTLSSKEHFCGCYGGGGGGGGYVVSNNYYYGKGYDHQCCSSGSDLVYCNNPMAADDDQDQSRITESLNNNNNEADGSSSNKDDWLQLSIGGGDKAGEQDEASPPRPKLVELDLLPSGGGSSQAARKVDLLTPSSLFHAPLPPPPSPPAGYGYVYNNNNKSTSLFSQQTGGGDGSSSSLSHQDINWAFRPVPPNNPFPTPPSSYFARPFHLHPGVDVLAPSPAPAAATGSTFLDLRVIDPPRRPHSGIWLMLQASQNQAKEPFLAQIPKNYLRIKDGRMNVRLLMKYLANKLRLGSESEIEVTCRGQKLAPFLTLQHVRDVIWSPRNAVTLLPESSTAAHVMLIHYGRSA